MRGNRMGERYLSSKDLEKREKIEGKKGRCETSKEKKGFESLSKREREILEIFAANISRIVKGKMREKMKREYFYDPRDDEMMSEIYPQNIES